ncbi:MAG TPA: quinone oxidoreductase [Gammaproteobacteria bacterium]|nr:quinone oxidoreductase [Gammaproteobacteria bacterium]
MKAVRVHEHGGPEVMRLDEIELPSPGPGQVRVEIAAAGVNFIDVQFRTGGYATPALPFTLGMEGAGTVTAIGEGVTEVKLGARVAYAMVPGSYAASAIVPASRLVGLPDGIDFESAAAAMLQGMTAHYLTHSTYALKPGDSVLVHAAAGGVGLLLTQIARKQGARVFGTVGNREKAAIARAAGAEAVIIYTEEDFEAEVKRLTDGEGVNVVYDSVGRDTFDRSLDCLKPRGYLVLLGFTSGPVAPFDPALLGAKGSLFLTRPGLPKYIATREELLGRAGDLFRWIESGELKLDIDRVLPLAEAADAHRALESRATTGKLLLAP